MATKSGKFDPNLNRGTKKCTVCGTLKQEANIERGHGGCNDEFGCYTLAGNENDHSDTDHEYRNDKDANGKIRNCPTCYPELEALYTKEGRKAFKEGR